jgi:uncharacterized membrane protein YgcG
MFIFIFNLIGIDVVAREAFIIENFQVVATLSADGSFTVQERITVNFSEERRGIFRKIPLINEVDGKRQDLKISDVRVDNWESKVSRQRGELEIRIGHPDRYVRGRQNYTIFYKVENGILHLASHDEFYWNLTGTEWDTEIRNTSFSIRYPAEWQGEIYEYKAFSGYEGETGSAIYLDQSPGVISGASSVPLKSTQGVTIAVKIPKGLISEFSETSRIVNDGGNYRSSSSRKWYILFPLGFLTLLYNTWRRFGKRTPYIYNVEDQHFAPDDLSPAEVGTFYDYKVNRRDIISLLPYWGELGLITIKPIGRKDRDFYFKKLQDLPSDRPEYEKFFFNTLFKDGDTVLLSDLKEEFYSTMYKVSSKIKKDVLKKELYDKKAYSIFHAGWMIAAFILLVLIGILTILLLQAVIAGIGCIMTGVFALILHFLKPRHSEKGEILHAKLEGLYNFLKNPDGKVLDNLMKDDPGYLNKMFPYALAFGLDKTWSKQFNDLYSQPPHWYINPALHHSSGLMKYGQFAYDFKPHKIEQVFYSAPASNSSGSSNGGGFSGGSVGGGFGGGGGGSW